MNSLEITEKKGLPRNVISIGNIIILGKYQDWNGNIHFYDWCNKLTLQNGNVRTINLTQTEIRKYQKRLYIRTNVAHGI